MIIWFWISSCFFSLQHLHCYFVYYCHNYFKYHILNNMVLNFNLNSIFFFIFWITRFEVETRGKGENKMPIHNYSVNFSITCTIYITKKSLSLAILCILLHYDIFVPSCTFLIVGWLKFMPHHVMCFIIHKIGAPVQLVMSCNMDGLLIT